MKFYLFGAVPASDKELDLEAVEILGEKREVSLLEEGDVGFLFSEAEVGSKLRASRKNVQTHAEALGELISSFGTLAPVPFGTLLESKEEVRELIGENYDQLKGTLTKISGQVEFGLKAYWDSDEIAKIVGEENEEVQKIKKKIEKGSVANSYEETLKVGELIEEGVEKRRGELKEDILEHLGPVVNDWKENELFDERMAANMAFLIDKSEEGQFDQAMEELGETQPEYLSFNYSGPWPPFNFVELELN